MILSLLDVALEVTQAVAASLRREGYDPDRIDEFLAEMVPGPFPPSIDVRFRMKLPDRFPLRIDITPAAL